MINRKNGFINLRSVSAKIVTVLLSLVFMGCSVLGNSDSDDDTLTLAAAFALLANQDFDCTDDGLIWTEATLPETNAWEGIGYGNGLFVAVSVNGTNQVMTSPDGLNWTARAAAGSTLQWSDVKFGNNTFVAVGQSGTDTTKQIMTSPDGITWTRQTEPGNATYFRLAFGNGVFAASPISSAKVLVTTDGTSSSEITTPIATAQQGNIGFGNGIFLMFDQQSKNQSLTSTDAVTWATHSVPTGSWGVPAFGNGKMVAVGSGTNTLMYSTNGIDGWTTTTDPTGSGTWVQVVYGGGLFVALNYQKSPAVIISTDGINWTSVSGLTTSAWSNVAYGNGKFVAVSENGKAMVSACD